MRKFNLKGKVAEKLKGLETAAPLNQNADNGSENEEIKGPGLLLEG